MTANSDTNAQENQYQISFEANRSLESITLTSRKGINWLSISKDDENAICETLYLNSIQGMAESIQKSEKDDVFEIVYDPNEDW